MSNQLKTKKDEGEGLGGDWHPWLLRQKALQETEVRLTAEPQAIESLFDRARLLTELGRTQEAKEAYLELLSLSPTHFGALLNLGALLYSEGFRTAARTCYSEAVARHPDNPLGHFNLADLFSKEGELALARTHYEQALRLAPDHAEAHQGLAHLLRELGDEEGAKRHRRLGYEKRAVIVWPYRGRNQPVPVTLLASAMGGNIPIQPFLDEFRYLVTVIFVEFYDQKQPLGPHRLLLNSIGDADLCGAALEIAEKLAVSTEVPVLNRPEAVCKTGRLTGAARLSNVPGVITPRVAVLPREVLKSSEAETVLSGHGIDAPFLLRAPGFHNGHHFLRVENGGKLAAAVDRLPGQELWAMQFLDGRGRDNKVRKYRVMMIDGCLYPLHAAISSNWKIHWASAEMAENAAHRIEERDFLENMETVLGPLAMKALEDICDVLGLDYAGVDFSLNDSGELLLFEANAPMIVPPPDPGEQWAYRRAPVERIGKAVREMLAHKIDVGPAKREESG